METKDPAFARRRKMVGAARTKIAEMSVNQQAEATEIVVPQNMRHDQPDDLSTPIFSFVPSPSSLHYARFGTAAVLLFIADVRIRISRKEMSLCSPSSQRTMGTQ
jgi:hypothetical protein